ncbi:sulfatase [Virgibacillus profundi]|uniref:Sulfatase n=1 Tax=Virgibacillus profundi TaxID=2024555 RepID=A0A2A2IHB6_9BACI|nr:sulfatase-like hydrolase/transferase [Virgibacillus profundi]PAV30768.1 sulfatase [Virgibacillus profundi]PXY54951.1 DUF4976 domain-containing protein [Virgibacillus profundi]
MKPNILLITSDQQHWDTIGAFNDEISTPNIDRLVKEGTTFKRAYCPNPTCTPTRASIITGMYPSQHGAWTLGTKLSEDIRTVGDEMQETGYRTALIGKAHFQPTASTDEYESIESMPLLQDQEYWKKFTGPYYGFERVEMLRNHAHEHLVGQHYVNWLEEKKCTNWRDYFAAPTGKMTYEDKYKWKLPEKYHYNSWIAERTNSLMETYQQNGEPFFIWASFPDPHPPYLVSEPWDEMYDPERLKYLEGERGEHEHNPEHFQLTQDEDPDFSKYKESGYAVHGLHSHKLDVAKIRKNKAVYYGMISFMDKYVGRILDQLEKIGIAENTIVIFTSDHGHLFGQHDMHYKGPFHYEDLLKVPFVIRYPGEVPAGSSSDAMQSLVDLAPTLLELIGEEIPDRMTGESQTKVWLNQVESARDHVICENHHEPSSVHLKTYVNERYKITVYYNQIYGELFDLKKDPGEYYNLWNVQEYAELKQELLLKLVWAELGKEPMWMPRISGA